MLRKMRRATFATIFLASLQLSLAQNCGEGIQYGSVLDDCRSYINCQSTTKFKCPAGQYWSCFHQQCRSSTFFGCCISDPKTFIYPQDETCNASVTFKITDEQFGNSHAVCENSRIVLRPNRADRAADAATETVVTTDADYVYEYEEPIMTSTGKETTTPKTTTTSTTTTTKVTDTTTPNPQPMNCDQQGQTWADKNDCRSYYQCSYGDIQKKRCPIGLWWNCFQKRCTIVKFTGCCKAGGNSSFFGEVCFKNGKKSEDQEDETKYYQCENFQIVSKDCPHNYVFNSNQYRCVKKPTKQR